MNRRVIAVTVAVAAAAATASVPAIGAAAGVSNRTTATCALPAYGPGTTYNPQFHPAKFPARVDNPMFPLTPGRTLIYSGTKDNKKALDLFAPSTRTRVIDGVRTRVVQDRLFLNSVLEERTSDYYAQDRCGNVWYFGEDTATLDRHGHVLSREGSFHAGIDGAQPGVFMQATPTLGRKFRQEWYRGQAEDTYKAIDLSMQKSVPYGSFHNTLRTAETTALEPNVLDNKWYVRGIGEIEEVTVKGATEKLVLVGILS